MKGLKAESKVANSLRRAGASVTQSPGSRGSADLVADFGSKIWFTQVKSSNSGKPAGLSSREEKNLIARAENNNGTAVLAQVTRGEIKYISVKSDKELKP